ncbi:hypothetical protein Ahy_B03g066955 isoform F [Arachis hypogaea]|uniref:No apical meristem-associated C-terminal domain-containing protein n=1 Tax=Arachis hypogaea TaxID=3818 RepID=A0A445A5A9_ARAHY|nr:hypothetical protein Ahy_B03g066955 isoform F [Arachis hypogaea]
MSEDFSERKSSVVKKLSLMEDIKNVREKELMDREKEREMDMQILNADTSTMSEKRRALHEIACEKIIAKWFT